MHLCAHQFGNFLNIYLFDTSLKIKVTEDKITQQICVQYNSSGLQKVKQKVFYSWVSHFV
jgi:hypothetical protein